MFGHLILGLLRDGKLHHGYDLVLEHKARTGTQPNSGNFYRELGKLSHGGLIETSDNPPDADPRRIPYRITETGRKQFDAWLLSPSSQDEELSSWLLFVDLVPPDLCARLLERLKEQLWLLSKSLTRAREDALIYGRANGHGSRYNSAAVLLLRRLKQVTAELDFLEELRREIDHL